MCCGEYVHVTLLHFVIFHRLFELVSRKGFTAANTSWAVRSLVCLNKGQRLLPCYWPLYRSERHQLGRAVTMPPVTFLLWCEQYFTDHEAQLLSGNWEGDRSKCFGRNDLFVVSIHTPFERTFNLNSFFTFYLENLTISFVRVSHCCCSSETFKVGHPKFEWDTTDHVDHMATSICTLAEHLNESTTWQWCRFDPTPLTHSRYLSTEHDDLSSMRDKYSGTKWEFEGFFPSHRLINIPNTCDKKHLQRGINSKLSTDTQW